MADMLSNEDYVDDNASPQDRLDMARFDNPRRLRRSLSALTVAFFMIIAMSSWAYVLNGASLGLLAAGTGGTITVYICCSVLYSSIVVSMAELSSFVPLAGGPYHWVSVLASPQYRRILSYTTGWLLTLSWSCTVASGIFILSQMIRLTATLGVADAAAPRQWEIYLISLAVALACLLLNTVGVRYLPVLEVVCAAVFAVGFVTTVVVYGVMGPKVDYITVFTTFTNGGGWSNTGFAVMTAQAFVIFCLLGSDGAAHMAEETRDASISVPRGMIWSYAFSAISSLSMLVLFCFCYTTEAEALTATYTYPFLSVNLVITGSARGAQGLTSIVIILTFLSTNNFVAASSRQLMAFAGDGGVPFHRWVAHVPSGLKYPLNAVVVTIGFAILLNLITLGSTVAFQAIISLVLLAFIGTYELSIGVLIWRRLRSPLPTARWSMGRFGLPVNIFAALYGVFMVAFIVVPASPNFDAVTFNWAPVIFVGFAVVAILFYIVGGRRSFEGPILRNLQSEPGSF